MALEFRFRRPLSVWAALLALVLLGGPAPRIEARAAEAGAALFQAGQYKAAYAALWPALCAGDVEAAFYSLVIRRNGLDGRAAAEASELAALWRIVAANRALMSQKLTDKELDPATEVVYRSALAELEYFGSLSSWPPEPPGPEQEARIKAAKKMLADAPKSFTPAMNFLAFLNSGQAGEAEDCFKFTLRAAEAGDFVAAGNLAWLYRQGLGTDKNDLRAAHWAWQGCQAQPPVPRSMNEVGYFYESGRGVNRDAQEAARYYERAAGLGHKGAAANLKRLRQQRQSSPQLDDGLLF